MAAKALTADDIIELLSLKPHPEGGWYSESFRDESGSERGHSTAIYFLLKAGESSHWHRVLDAAEIWHWYSGASLTLKRSTDGITTETLLLGPDLGSGQRPQHVIKPGEWQSAKSNGDWTLVGCTVAPGFEFENFELAPPDWTPEDQAR